MCLLLYLFSIIKGLCVPWHCNFLEMLSIHFLQQGEYHQFSNFRFTFVKTSKTRKEFFTLHPQNDGFVLMLVAFVSPTGFCFHSNFNVESGEKISKQGKTNIVGRFRPLWEAGNSPLQGKRHPQDNCCLYKANPEIWEPWNLGTHSQKRTWTLETYPTNWSEMDWVAPCQQSDETAADLGFFRVFSFLTQISIGRLEQFFWGEGRNVGYSLFSHRKKAENGLSHWLRGQTCTKIRPALSPAQNVISCPVRENIHTTQKLKCWVVVSVVNRRWGLRW